MLTLTLEIVIVLALIGINGLLAMSELALVSSQRFRLQQKAESGDEGAARALALATEPTRFLSTIQIGITLVAIVAGAFGGARIATRIAGWLEDAGASTGVSGSVSVVLVILVIAYLSLVLGELAPKRVALRQPERIAARIARPMQLLALIGAPFVTILSASTSAVLRPFGVRAHEEAPITEEEIRLLIGLSAQSGSVAEAEAKLLERVFHFGDRKVHEVMIPRTEAVWLERGSTLAHFFSVYSRAPHSRFPVFEDSPDKVVGILGIKDILAALSESWLEPDSSVDHLQRPPFFVPETKPIGELFRELQAAGVQMAIAVDEFGGTAGIVTLEQLLEEMVGPMHDELSPADVEIETIDELTTRVDGSLSIEEAREELDLDIPEGPYDTIAGFVLSRLGHIPQVGEQVPYDGYRITVEAMRGPKIELLRFTQL